LEGDVPAQWWTLFRNPQLDETIRVALANSPTLTQAQAKLREAQENLASYRRHALPQVDANFNATRQQVNLQSVGITQFPSPGPFTLYNASVQVSYALDLFGGQRRELEGLQAAVDYQRYELEAARLSLAANVATAAIREAGLRAQLADTVAMADAQKRQLGIMQQRFGLGGVARRRAAPAGRTCADTGADSGTVAADRCHASPACRLHRPDPAAAQLPEFRLEDMQLPETLPVSLPSELARRRPIFGRQKHCSIRPRRISAWPRPTSIRRSR
jgi:outer membrane protein TolC